MTLMVTVMTCVMMVIMTRAPTTMIRMKTMTIMTSKKILQSESMYCIWHMLCEGGEGEGCEDCSDQGAAG